MKNFTTPFGTKKNHKKKIDRDILIFELYDESGMRRAELANLKVKDIHKDSHLDEFYEFLIVIKGKGEKD